MARTYQKSPEVVVPQLRRMPQLTLNALAKSTSFDDRQNSAGVRLAAVDPVRAPSGLPGRFKVMRGRTHTDENGHQHTPRLFYQDPYLTPDSKVIADCTCPRHAFYYEVANARQGASFIYRSNGAKPKVTNPGMQVGLCKHLYRLASYLIRQAKGQVPAGPQPAKGAPAGARGKVATRPAPRGKGRR